MTAKAWTHSELMRLVPYEQPDTFHNTTNKVAIAVMFKDRQGPQGAVVPATAELMAPYSGIATQARRLIFAAPMMYQTLAATASFMRSLINEVENLQAQGATPAGNLEAIIQAYEQIERECLTVMQVATNGLEQTAKAVKGGKS